MKFVPKYQSGNWLPDFEAERQRVIDEGKPEEIRRRAARIASGIIPANYRYNTENLPPYNIKTKNFNELWDWLWNWFGHRRKQLKTSAHQPNWWNLADTSVFFEGGDPKITNANSIGKASDNIYEHFLSEQPNKIETAGYYNGTPKYIVLLNSYNENVGENIDRKSTLVHESTHALFPHISNVDSSKIKLNSYYTKDNYLDNPEEIYSRLMQLRWGLGLNPNQKITKGQIIDWKQRKNIDFDNVRDSYGLQKAFETLIDRYDEDTLLYLLNDVAKNNIHKKENSALAKSGGKLNYLNFFK